MKKYIFIGAFCASIAIANQKASAQTDLMRIEVDGVRATSYGTDNVEGSPFLKEEWTPGTATSKNGESYQVNLKYDIVKDNIIFEGKDEGPMIFSTPISRFTLNGSTYANGFPSVDTWNDATYYEVMGAGKTKLLRHFFKRKQAVRDIGGISGYKYEDDDVYYLLKDGRMNGIKPTKSSLLDALNDKKDKVESFAKQNKINFKNDADLAKLMDYYNSIWSDLYSWN